MCPLLLLLPLGVECLLESHQPGRRPHVRHGYGLSNDCSISMSAALTDGLCSDLTSSSTPSPPP